MSLKLLFLQVLISEQFLAFLLKIVKCWFLALEGWERLAVLHQTDKLFAILPEQWLRSHGSWLIPDANSTSRWRSLLRTLFDAFLSMLLGSCGMQQKSFDSISSHSSYAILTIYQWNEVLLSKFESPGIWRHGTLETWQRTFWYGCVWEALPTNNGRHFSCCRGHVVDLSALQASAMHS